MVKSSWQLFRCTERALRALSPTLAMLSTDAEVLLARSGLHADYARLRASG